MGNKTTALRPEILNDLQQQTNFTESEISDLYRQFIHDCEDKSKMHMTVDQFKKMYREIFPNGDADKFAQHVFRTVDKSGKGHINFRQFIMSLNIQLNGTMKQKLNWLIDLYDIHRTGYIDKTEFKEMIEVLINLKANVLEGISNQHVDELVEHIFNKAEATNQQKLSRDNFIQSALKSKTMQMILEGATQAVVNPYVLRRERSGSIGLPQRSRSGTTSSVKSKLSNVGMEEDKEKIKHNLGRRFSYAYDKSPLRPKIGELTRQRSASVKL